MRKLAIPLILLCASCSTSGSFEPRAASQGADPGAAEEHPVLAIARQHFRNGNYALAAREYRRLIRHRPELADAYNGLAASYDKMGRFDLAQRYYQEALALAPTDPAVRHNLGLSLRLQGRAEEARQLAFENAELGIASSQFGSSDLSTLPRLASNEPIAEQPPERPQRIYRLSIGEVALITEPDSEMAREAGLAMASLSAAPPDAVRSGDGDAEWSWKIADAAPAQAEEQPSAWTRIFRSVASLLVTNRYKQGAQSAHRFPASHIRLTSAGPEWHWRLGDSTRTADTRPVRVLNAVGRRGQAARMRRHLSSAGWDNVSIGNARQARQSSLIMYAQGERGRAQAIARTLPFPTRLVESESDRLVLVLGDDAVAFDRRLQGALIS